MEGEGFDFEALDEENELSTEDSVTQADDLIGSARFVTALSDFGQMEQFVIEGDSMLDYAFRDCRLDWKHGGQFMHLAFVVENLLSSFLSRGSHFSVVFFDCHKSRWSGSGSRKLARCILISHLKDVLRTPISLHIFDSPSSEGWVAFLKTYRPAFIAVSEDDVSPLKPTNLTQFTKACHTAGFNIFFLNDVEFLENSVKGFYVCSSLTQNFHPFLEIGSCDEVDGADFVSDRIESSPHFAEILKITESSWRSIVCVWALSFWLRRTEHERACDTVDAKAAAKIFLLHIVLLRRRILSVSERSLLKVTTSESLLASLTLCSNFVCQVVEESAWNASNFTKDFLPISNSIELVDFMDGRLFCSLADALLKSGGSGDALGLDEDVLKEFKALWLCTVSLSGVSESDPMFPIHFSSTLQSDRTCECCSAGKSVVTRRDLIIKDLELIFSDRQSRESGGLAGIDPESFLGSQGWQIKEPMESFLWTHCQDQSASVDTSARSVSEWERRRQLRRKARQSQMYFRHLHDYAASLAGSTVLGSTCISGDVEEEGDADIVESKCVEDDTESASTVPEGDSKKGKGKGKSEKGKPEKKGDKKGDKKLSKKEQLLADIEAKKQKDASLKLAAEWKELKSAIKKSSSSLAKLKDLDDFHSRCQVAGQVHLALEVLLDKLLESKSAWQEDRESKSNNMKFAILTVETVRIILAIYLDVLRDTKLEVARRGRGDLIQTMAQLGFADSAMQISRGFLSTSDERWNQEMQVESLELVKSNRSKLSVSCRSLQHFQLEHMGYLLPRPPPKVKDPRISSFTPDDWQRTLLDVVDARESALVCAPTSSGKTFISYYCMEKVMRDPVFKDGVLVFVAPTKALINQIAAQVYGAYHTQFGIFTDAYRHRVLTCRILVTVPDCLESLLLSPEHAIWAQRIRYIILDEVHCISSSEGGRLWEHILLLSNAPFLALSATVGEPEEFRNWLQQLKDAQRESDGKDEMTRENRDQTYAVRLVQHSERWVDLRRHVYIGSGSQGVKDAPALVKSGRLHLRARVDHTSAEIDMAEVLETLHPLASFSPGQLDSCKVPVNLRFEPRDTLLLFNAMSSVCLRSPEGCELKKRAESMTLLDPLKYFVGEQVFITRPQSVAYEQDVKREFETWMSSAWRPDCLKVLSMLGNKDAMQELRSPSINDDSSDDEMVPSRTPTKQDRYARLFQLMCALHRQDRLPAVIFNFDRSFCENAAFAFNDILAKAEEISRVENAKNLAKSSKVEQQKEKAHKRIRDKVLSEKKEEAMLQELAEMADTTTLDAGLDEATFKAQFTFVQEGRSSKQDFERITESARKIMGEGHPLIQILRRGIGVHHSGLQNKYRMAVEMLFRCGFLRIVLATETLAFGINMPCRSVVFAGDHVALNSVQFQQMSGRAGRRGLDVLGHVIFFDIPRQKVHRLLTAPVPRLHGHFIHSPSFLLRLLTLGRLVPLQRGMSKHVEARVHNAIRRALEMSQQVSALQLQHLVSHLLDGLHRSGLVDRDGKPAGLSTLALHFHAAEPANLALLALIQSGSLHKLCDRASGTGWDFTSVAPLWRGSVAEWETLARDLLVVLSHLFCRERLHPRVAALAASQVDRRGVVLLPDLSDTCRNILELHHSECLATISAAATSISSELAPPQVADLPLSKIGLLLASDGNAVCRLNLDLQTGSIRVCHGLSCLSGNADMVGTCQELLLSGRKELGLHNSLAPLVLGGPAWSAYILDFFNLEQLDVVCREHCMSSAVAWQGLKQFQSILSSLNKALTRYAPSKDVLRASISRLESEFSSKFYAKLYR